MTAMAPCIVASTATLSPDSQGELRVFPHHKRKALRALESAMKTLGAPLNGGLLTIESDIPEGKGMGSSTADCIAAVIAAASSMGQKLKPSRIAEIVVQSEIASGNVMFEKPVLFAHREGRVLEDYFRDLPPLLVLGFDTEGKRIVETLLFPPAEYSRRELETFRVLTAALRRAILKQDAVLLGRVATASAQINQKFLPKPLFRELCCLANQVGCLGIVVAHSGTVAGLLLDAIDPACYAKAERLLKELDTLGISEVLQFST
jgi:uncharacterized protein involved in propanediol utilization